MMDIYEKIDLILDRRGISRRKLAQAAGIPTSTFQSIMERHRGLTIETLHKIANALGCNVADLDESLSVSASDMLAGLAAVANEDEENRKRIDAAYSKLNAEGRAKAAERIEELTEIKRFCHDATLYDQTVQALKEEQGCDAVQTILDRSEDIVFIPDADPGTK